MKKILLMMATLWVIANATANNIQISNISVDAASSTIEFDVSWDNGWRSAVLNNWDAAYVFFYYKLPTGEWTKLELQSTNAVVPSGFSFDLTSYDGVFLYRSSVGGGQTTLLNVRMGIPAMQATGQYDIRGFAIEMVYIPEAPFYVGDGGSTQSYPVTEISGINTTIVDPIGSVAITNSPFPNGFSPFYVMKYELSQGGYRDFLNTLTYQQQIPHIVPAPNAAAGTPALFNANRNYLKIKTPGLSPGFPAVFGCDANGNGVYDEAADGENVACNYLNWVDQIAYLSWAGLHPLTEFQYEKITRGIQLPSAGEFAWGNTSIHNITFLLTNANQAGEAVSNGASSPTGNANYAATVPTPAGPLRNGIFATAVSNRQTSGGSFYGVMDMSGNLIERVVRQSYSYSNIFYTPYINANGFGYYIPSMFSPSIIPGSNTAGSEYIIDGLTPATGVIYRGGSFNNASTRLRISDRGGLLVTDTNTDRSTMSDVGVRGGVRF